MLLAVTAAPFAVSLPRWITGRFARAAAAMSICHAGCAVATRYPAARRMRTRTETMSRLVVCRHRLQTRTAKQPIRLWFWGRCSAQQGSAGQG